VGSLKTGLSVPAPRTVYRAAPFYVWW